MTLIPYRGLKQETLANMKKLLQMSKSEAIRLVDDRFEGQHAQVLQGDVLRRDLQSQFAYLETLFEDNEETINNAIRSYGIDGLTSPHAAAAKMYIELIKLRLKLCCQMTPKNVYATVEKMVKSGDSKQRYLNKGAFYPIEDCLHICEDHKQLEACFLLNKKLGRHFEAVTQGLSIIRDKVDLNKVKVELYFAKLHNYSVTYPVSNMQLSESAFFDSIFRRLFNILIK
jgi:hypothetical protein